LGKAFCICIVNLILFKNRNFCGIPSFYYWPTISNDEEGFFKESVYTFGKNMKLAHIVSI